MVHGVLRIAPLGQAAVDHDVEAVELQQVAGAGDAVLGADMGKAIVSHRSTQMNTDKMNFYHEGHEENGEIPMGHGLTLIKTDKERFYQEDHESHEEKK